MCHSIGRWTAATATAVTIIRLNAAKRVHRPSSRAKANSSSAQVAMVQLMLAGITLNGNGKSPWMSANQFSPLSFSRPDSKNSQNSSSRRNSGASHWPRPSRRATSERQSSIRRCIGVFPVSGWDALCPEDHVALAKLSQHGGTFVDESVGVGAGGEVQAAVAVRSTAAASTAGRDCGRRPDRCRRGNWVARAITPAE